MEATPGGFMLLLALIAPVTGLLLAFALGGVWAERIAMALLPAGVAISLTLVAGVLHAGAPIVTFIGGWAPPLGLALRGDGIAVVMLLTTSLILGAVGLFARPGYAMSPGDAEARAPLAFWVFLLALWAALNAAFLGGDLFNLFVALEMLTFAALVRAYSKVYNRLLRAGLKPQLQRLDNECSTELKEFMAEKQVHLQLVPPGNHRANAAERAIRTFKNHFIAGLSTTDPGFQLHLWDRLIPQ